MLKLTFLMRRKEGLSRQEFRDYYENNHAPMAGALCPNLVHYKRTYLREMIPMSRKAAGSEPDFDCLTECWYDVEGGWNDRRGDLLPPEVFKKMAADEENFMDRASTRLILTEQCTSAAETLCGT